MEEENKLPFERLKEHLREISTPTGISYSGDKTISKENAEWFINLVEEQLKVIDMMAEDICIYATESHYSAVRRNFGNDSVYIRPKETMKEYYLKKARGEEDVKN